MSARIEILNQEYCNNLLPKICLKDCVVSGYSLAEVSEGLTRVQISWDEMEIAVNKDLEQINEGKSYARRWLTISCLIVVLLLISFVLSAVFDKDVLPFHDHWKSFQQYIGYCLIGISILIQIVVRIRMRTFYKRVFRDVELRLKSYSKEGIEFSVKMEKRRITRAIIQKPLLDDLYYITVDIAEQYAEDEEMMVIQGKEEPNPSDFYEDLIPVPLKTTRDSKERLEELEGLKDHLSEEEYILKRTEILNDI